MVEWNDSAWNVFCRGKIKSDFPGGSNSPRGIVHVATMQHELVYFLAIGSRD